MSKKDIPIVIAVILVLVGAPLIIFIDKIFGKSAKTLAEEQAKIEQEAKVNNTPTQSTPKASTPTTPKKVVKEHTSFYIPKSVSTISYKSTPLDTAFIAGYISNPTGKTFIPISFKAGYPIGWVEIEKDKWVKDNIGTRGTLIF